MKNNFILLLLALLCTHNNSFSQTPTFTTKYSTLQDEMPTDAVETADGGFIIAAKQGDRASYIYHTLLIKINSMGDTVNTRVLSDPDGNCFIFNLHKSDDGNFFGSGSYQVSTTERNIWFIKFDENLNLLFDKKHYSGCQDIDVVLQIRNHAGKIILFGDGYTDDYNSDDIFIYKVTQDGDSLFYRKYLDYGSEWAWSMFENHDLSSYTMTISGEYQIPPNEQLLVFDSTFNVTSIQGIPNSYHFYYNTMRLGSNFLLTGIKTAPLSPPPLFVDKNGIMKLDSSYAILDQSIFGSESEDTLCYPAYMTNLDSADIKNIYYGGTYNQDNNYIFSEKKSWFLLTKLDTNLALKWEKYYGGDSYYGLWSVNATSDGGCLLSGTTFNYFTQNNERDIIIIKVDSNGVVTGTDNLPSPLIHDAIVFPNPGCDQLNIRTGLKNAIIEFYDESGKFLLRKSLQQGLTTYKMSDFSLGMYYYKILQHDKLKESGKWIRKDW
jgi:hypothetical protein